MIYLSGPMTGYPEFNYPLFNQTAAVIRSYGYKVCNPAEFFDGKTDLPKETYMRQDIRAVLDCEMVVTLPKWEESPGAKLEVEVARACGIPVIDLQEFFILEATERSENHV
jgi:nucleoside 2-deoxyribosyltransferase